MPNLEFQRGLIERTYWLIKLRWIAIVGLLFTILFVKKIVGFNLPYLALSVIAAILATYNLIFLAFLNIIKNKTADIIIIANRLANIQILFDLLSLTALIHFSGGIENPFLFYFIFHMIIASILLSPKAAYLQATFAVFLFCSVVLLEYYGLIAHYCLMAFIRDTLHNNIIYIGGISFVFISTIYIAVYMATSISNRLREREKRLKEANELLQEKDRIKSEYVFRVTHDIKEHVSTIQSCIEPVVEQITGALNDRQSDLLKRASERAGRLLFFIKELLEITRIKLSKDIKMKNLSIKKVMENAISNIEQKAKNKDIAIFLDIETAVDKIQGEETYIEEAIINILANSVKYTAENGKISIKVVDRAHGVLFEIKDTGIGIPKEELPKIFEEFFRASNAKEINREGAGLGLAIAKQIVLRHKGKIWAESQEGKGSIFYIMLPK